MSLRRRALAGFTLIELMITLAVMAVLIALVAPSFRDMIDMQRLRGTSAQFVTDVQFARSEAVARQVPVAITLGSNLDMTCYMVHTCQAGVDPTTCTCDCTQREGARCPVPLIELRVVQLQREAKVEVNPTANPLGNSINFILFDPLTGGMRPWNVGVGGIATSLDGAAWSKTSLLRGSTKTLRTMISQGGRPSVCTPMEELVSGALAC